MSTGKLVRALTMRDLGAETPPSESMPVASHPRLRYKVRIRPSILQPKKWAAMFIEPSNIPSQPWKPVAHLLVRIGDTPRQAYARLMESYL
jgi:hypothetical protein